MASENRRIDWRRAAAVGGAVLLVGTQTIAIAIAGGWAIAGIFRWGGIGQLVLEIVFGGAGLLATYAFARQALRVEPIFTTAKK